VAHGFLFHAPSVVVLGASHYYDLADELGCHWRDPQLGIAWPSDSARVSARDSALPPLRELSGRIPPWAP
jgi:dTDP-4-dehydrorhamnose 3,5-epimerase-like enzyme